MNKKNIVKFVKEVLGCNCPEEVFSNVTKVNETITDSFAIDIKINIGNKLLVYIMKPDNKDELQSILPLVVKHGKAERDEFKYNRIRLVFVTDYIVDINPLQHLFAMASDNDEKIHLHFIDNDTFQSLKYN